MDATKIIKGAVSSGRYTVTAPIVKEDYGLYLQIEGVELPSTYEVDFSNSESNGTSVTMIGNADGVLIPSQFISTGKDVFAFLYHVGEDFGRTVYKFRIPNKVRPDRTDEEPTPEEQSVIDQLIGALNSAVEQTGEDVESASQSAQSAESAKTAAESARDTAGEYANDAQSSAESASESARVASEKATASAQSASEAETARQATTSLVAEAQGYADTSAQSASASANSASQAQGFAQSASASANSASGYASQADISANTASSKATEASTSAQTASQKATESAQSASQALGYKNDAESAKTASQTAQGLAESARDDAEQIKTDVQNIADGIDTRLTDVEDALSEKAPVITDTASGAIASFSDGADNLPLKSLIVDINPVQDLHGQGSPYPAGGGANKFDGIVVAGGSYLLSANYIPVTEGQTWYIYAPNFPANNYCYGKLYDSNFSEIDAGTTHRIGRNTTYTIPSGVAYIKLRYWGTFDATNMAFNYPATVTTYSPYENLCPISGWTEVDVEQRGVNVWDEEWEVGTINNTTGLPSPDANNIRAKNYCPCKPNTSYFFYSGSSKILRFYWYDAEQNHISTDTANNTIKASPDNAYYFKVRTTDNYGDTYNHDISINYPSTDHDYHPYTGRSITISLGQTVYGAKLYPLEGKALVDMAVVDMGDLTWQRYTSETNIPVFYARIEDMYISSLNTALCSMFKTVSWETLTNRTDKTVCSHPSLNIIYVADSDYDNASDFTTAVNGEQYCYKLATPLTIQLTPNQVNSLLGVNNIWADSGDTEVEYRADTKLSIERLTAPDSADMIADSNITSGQYFMVGNSLYKATANIASGSAVIVGTNATRKSLSEALNEINA